MICEVAQYFGSRIKSPFYTVVFARGVSRNGVKDCVGSQGRAAAEAKGLAGPSFRMCGTKQNQLSFRAVHDSNADENSGVVEVEVRDHHYSANNELNVVKSWGGEWSS